jgi:peroxiredoxin
MRRNQFTVLAVLLFACGQSPSGAASSAARAPETKAEPATRAESQASATPKTSAGAAPAATAALGAPAPDFTLTSLDGKSVTLSSLRGKIVVLEWFNPDCPFVKASHQRGPLKTAARDAAKQGVVWLAINSSAEGKQGHGVETNRRGAEAFALEHPILLDGSGSVGRAYGATRTPHLFIVDANGTLVYRGAADNSPDGESANPEGGPLENYLVSALDSLLAGKPIAKPDTKPYGCSVKYGS